MKRLAKADYVEQPPQVNVLSEDDFNLMLEDIKSFVELEPKTKDELKQHILIELGYADKGATGDDLRKAIDELTKKIVDTPAEYDEEGNLIQEEVSHYDYKFAESFYPVEEE